MAKKTWTDRTIETIKSGVIPEGVIKSIVKRINGLHRCARDARIVTADESRIMQAIREHKPCVTPEQVRKGIDWLYNKVYTPRGALRRADAAGMMQQLRPYATLIADSANALREGDTSIAFRLEGFAFTGPYSVVPMYGLYVSGRRAFGYAFGSWQAGSPLRVFANDSPHV